jgi:hypothetical protein
MRLYNIQLMRYYEEVLALEKANLDLVEMETKALELVNNDQASEAVKLLESDEYERRRKILRDGLTEQVEATESGELDQTSESTDVVSDSVKTTIRSREKII